MASLNHPQREDEAPYPWSLLGMAQAVIAVVQGRGGVGERERT